jgi:hypothetical protein
MRQRFAAMVAMLAMATSCTYVIARPVRDRSDPKYTWFETPDECPASAYIGPVVDAALAAATVVAYAFLLRHADRLDRAGMCPSSHQDENECDFERVWGSIFGIPIAAGFAASSAVGFYRIPKCRRLARESEARERSMAAQREADELRTLRALASEDPEKAHEWGAALAKQAAAAARANECSRVPALVKAIRALQFHSPDFERDPAIARCLSPFVIK